MMSQVGKMDITDILEDKDGVPDPIIADDLFNPHERLDESVKNDARLAPEVRKLLNKNEPEMQELRRPIVDQETADKYAGDYEFKMAYIQAKWLWYVDKKFSQMKLTMRDLETGRQHAEEYDAWVE